MLADSCAVSEEFELFSYQKLPLVCNPGTTPHSFICGLYSFSVIIPIVRGTVSLPLDLIVTRQKEVRWILPASLPNHSTRS